MRKNDLIKALIELRDTGECVSETAVLNEAISIISSTERKLGTWFKTSDHIRCNECREWYLTTHLRYKNFCPKCGVKMKREVENDS